MIKESETEMTEETDTPAEEKGPAAETEKAAEAEEEQKEASKPRAQKKSFFKKHRKLFGFLILLLILVPAGFLTLRYMKAEGEIRNAPEEEFREVERKDLGNYIAVTATVEADDKRTVSTLVSNTRVLDVYYEVGDYVHAGDVICIFDTSYVSENIARLKKKINVTTQKQNILMNDAQVDVNKAGTTWAYENQDDLTSVYRLQADYDRAVGEYYNSADGYSSAKKDKDSKGDARDSAKHDYEKAREAYDTLTDEEKAGAVELTPEKDAIKKTYDYYKALYDAAESAYSTAKSKVETYETDIRAKETSMITARQKLEDATIKTPRDYIKDNVEVQLAQEKQITAGLDASIANDENEKTMDEYEQQLENSVVRAPISGLITSLSVHPGDEFADRSKSEV